MEARHRRGEAEAEAEAGTGPGAFEAHETFGDMAALRLRDARAAIRDHDRHAVAALARIDADPGRNAGLRRPAVFEGVVEEVRHRLPEELAIAVHRQIRVD